MLLCTSDLLWTMWQQGRFLALLRIENFCQYRLKYKEVYQHDLSTRTFLNVQNFNFAVGKNKLYVINYGDWKFCQEDATLLPKLIIIIIITTIIPEFKYEL